jgi:hypothetical protein
MVRAFKSEVSVRKYAWGREQHDSVSKSLKVRDSLKNQNRKGSLKIYGSRNGAYNESYYLSNSVFSWDG